MARRNRCRSARYRCAVPGVHAPLFQSAPSSAVIRQHRFRMRWRQMPAEDKGYAERALVYAGDAHLQAVLDEYVYLLRHAAQADTVEKALSQIGDVWKLSRGSPRTNRARGHGSEVQLTRTPKCTLRISRSPLAKISQGMPGPTETTRRCARAWFARPSTPRSGRSFLPPPPWARRDWISISIAGTFCIGTCHRTPWISSSARAESIDETVWPFASRSRATGRSPALCRGD